MTAGLRHTWGSESRLFDFWIVSYELRIHCKSRCFFEVQVDTVTDLDTVSIMSQCGRGQSTCRLGGVGTAAARCWAGIPNHETRLSVVQDLVAFRLATCLCLNITTVAIVSQCGRQQSVCRIGGVAKAAAIWVKTLWQSSVSAGGGNQCA